jgi:integrase
MPTARSARRLVERRAVRGGGTRRERRPGVWEIRITAGPDPATGVSVQKSFTHQGDEASARARQRELVELYGAHVEPAPPQSAHMSVRELLEAFLDSPHPWSLTTRRSHTGEVRVLCRDRLGRARLDRMTQHTMETAIDRWVHAGASAALILARFRVLHSAITWALRNKLITTDPLAGMRTPTRPHPRLHLRPGEVHHLIATADAAVAKARARLAEHPGSRQRVLDLFHAEQDALLIRLAADSAARRGELVALHTSDLQGRVLQICRASQDGIIGPVKNHHTGRLTLAASTAAYWTRHVQHWSHHVDEQTDSGARWLFRATPESSTPLLPNGLGQRFEKLAHTAGLPHATLQRLRHTVGTYLVAHGYLMQASTRLRHHDLATTLNTYTHALPLDDEDTADYLANLYELNDNTRPVACGAENTWLALQFD